MQERIERCHLAGCTYRRRMVKNGRSGIAALEDKIVQAAVVMILTPVYEAEFLGLQLWLPTGPQ